MVDGIIGGSVVGCLSGSHTSVSGLAARLAAVLAKQVAIVAAIYDVPMGKIHFFPRPSILESGRFTCRNED
jgi:hypothetical protein